MRFRLLSGSYSDGYREYSPGQIVETATNLQACFPGMFELALEELLNSDGPQCSPPPSVEELELTKEERVQDVAESTAPVVKPKGEDVTSLFPLALEHDLIVRRTGRYFWVYDKENPSVMLNTDGQILLKKDVPAFLEEYATRS